MKNIALRIYECIRNSGYSYAELSALTKIPKSTLQKYATGETTKIPLNRIESIATATNVTAAYLMGWEDEKHEFFSAETDSYNQLGLRPITKKRFPMLGEIACGKPIFAEEDHESYVDALASIDADFCLTAKGDSMIGVRINDGDIVFIKKQPIVNNGEIAAVIIEDEAALKVWYYYPDQKKLILNPANKSYEPLVYTGAELDTITCLGKAVCYMSNL